MENSKNQKEDSSSNRRDRNCQFTWKESVQLLNKLMTFIMTFSL